VKIEPADVPGPDPALTSAQFHILLTLADGHRHGYGIMKEIERRTDSVVDLGPGTLYRSIKQLVARKLIIEVDENPQAGQQRRSYALTLEGRTCAAAEARRLQSLVLWAADAMALDGGQP